MDGGLLWQSQTGHKGLWWDSVLLAMLFRAVTPKKEIHSETPYMISSGGVSAESFQTGHKPPAYQVQCEAPLTVTTLLLLSLLLCRGNSHGSSYERYCFVFTHCLHIKV